MRDNMQIAFEDTELYLDEFLNQPKRVQQLLLLENIINNNYPSVFCEEYKSPIEAIFITAFELYIKYNNKKKIFLFYQGEIRIKANNKKYFADFLFEEDEYVNPYKTSAKVIIECDGHEFHQKTKEQVTKDNEREYDLKMEGYHVIRFSGSQIYRNPFKCAEEAYKYITKKIKEEWYGEEENDRP